jgi:nitroreductase
LTPWPVPFCYDKAFSRNIGWVTEWEQLELRRKKVAIAGMGGVGGVHLLTLVRLGVAAFHIADHDRFELANFNRQVGATLSTIGRAKVEVLAKMARDINPEVNITHFPHGIDEGNIDRFLDSVDLFIDGLDFFALDIRAKVFARCAELGIPAITAAPLGMGAAYLVFMPSRMTFEQYFRLEGLLPERQYVNFFMGLAPKGLQGAYLMDPTRMDLAGQRGPSSTTGCQLCAGVTGAEVVKILLGRGRVRAAPLYHQFDAYRAKWAAGRLLFGNRNPWQRLKLRVAYKRFAELSRESWQPPARDDGPEIERILDLARWAPSGDNTQPWRFEIEGEDKVRVRIRVGADNVYEYNGGQPTLLSAGMLLETMRVAASRFGRILWWAYRGVSGQDHLVDVELAKAPGVRPDPLLAYVHLRTVDRRPYRTTPLTLEEKEALAVALADELIIRWHEGWADRWGMARINGQATNIRLRIPEAFRVHQRILDWERRQSPDRIPAGAVGLDRLTLRVMRWAMGDWKRMDRLNRALGTLGARLQMDYLPGLACGAHFTVTRRASPRSDRDEVPSLLHAGEALQRFWLTATRLGLTMQPSLAPLCFASHGRHNVTFTSDAKARAQAAALAADLEKLLVRDPASLLFMGRLGWPRSRRVSPRSIRRPLEELLAARKESAERESARQDQSPREPPPCRRVG